MELQQVGVFFEGEGDPAFPCCSEDNSTPEVGTLLLGRCFQLNKTSFQEQVLVYCPVSWISLAGIKAAQCVQGALKCMV